eukprot:CAMPEP_0201519704 /NCGR_PEP_ID=MMETSP0161_2-20130828/10188_1 /ASSEMBLY_ACC=CAM_ASM_000251 /TAXON_ID=180227 /ORGANISM="Neoparamoeba aestuarina, Strain SoJaBio B1-5/56/2" /LENGTH=206 /DNA_ID=CAMNT_0047917821 /DNA_START=759 /DNA_END=1375 /DNA_ORIENTATION=+
MAWVVVGRMLGERESKKRREALGIIEDAEELMEVAELLDGEDGTQHVMLDELLFVSKMQDDDPFSGDETTPSSSSSSPPSSIFSSSYSNRSPSFSASPPLSNSSSSFSDSNPDSDDFKDDVERYLGWREKSLLQKILFLILSPLFFLESSTMPLLRDGYWSITRFFICICPISIPLSILAYYGGFTILLGGVMPAVIVVGVIGCVV